MARAAPFIVEVSLYKTLYFKGGIILSLFKSAAIFLVGRRYTPVQNSLNDKRGVFIGNKEIFIIIIFFL